jgi:hypothetical protein
VDHPNDPAGRNVGVLVRELLFDHAQQASVRDRQVDAMPWVYVTVIHQVLARLLKC